MKILSRWDDTVLWEGEAGSVKDAVYAALKEGANLAGANLTGADLAVANLAGADLSGANLTHANLTRANLTVAYLTGADLAVANLTGAYLTGAYLAGANLTHANLTGANLTRAYLAGANLFGADLTGANLTGAYLTGANLTGAKNVRLPTGETLEEYFDQTLPALLIAGGKPLESFHSHWECHDWDNCPMAYAFDVTSIDGVPILLRPRAQQFVQLFDAEQIPWTVVQDAIDKQKDGGRA